MRTPVWFLAALLNLPLQAQDVLTWHNDNARTGQNLEEKILTLQNVTPGRLASCSSCTSTAK